MRLCGALRFVSTQVETFHETGKKSTMKANFSDYDGPTGLFVATGKELLSLLDPAGATAFVGAGMQSGTIDPQQSI